MVQLFGGEKPPFSYGILRDAEFDKNGEKYMLYGMSTHGLAWFPQYVNNGHGSWIVCNCRLARFEF